MPKADVLPPHILRLPLREGFTTGTAATGAALAALNLLLQGSAPATVSVPLPPITPEASGKNMPPAERARTWLEVPVTASAPGQAPELAAMPETWPHGCPCAHARVRKDGGDDPDATNGALITASVFLHPTVPSASGRHSDTVPHIRLVAGPGVGRVTLPGLPVPVGAPAINPGPQAQLRFALWHALASTNGPEQPLTVVFSVPGGEELARHTLNPRLGIKGGISILGTQGTVRPYSNAAWRATVAQALSVATATGCRTVCLATGRRSERLLMRRYPGLPAQAFIQVADFAHFSLSTAGAMPLDQLIWGCFFGKFAKLALGLEYTHARAAPLNMTALATLCSEAGAGCAPKLSRCVTAAHALELLLEDATGTAALAAIGARAAETAHRFAGRPVTLHLFHTDGRELLSL